MTEPKLKFFCELDAKSIAELFSDREVVDALKDLKAGVSIGLLDLSQERADVVKKLNANGIPVTAWLILPKEEGYWANAFNVDQMIAFYKEFIVWTGVHGLRFIGVGIDIEPDINEIKLIVNKKSGVIPIYLRRLTKFNQVRRSETKYHELINQIQADGFFVETYQIPIIVDERKARSTLIRRLTGLVSVKSDRDVLMLYSSFIRPYGTGLIGSYAPEADAIGIGSTGGGVEIGVNLGLPITWEELSRDIQLGWYYKDHIYIFSLEGCVQNNYLEKIIMLDWDQPILLPVSNISKINRVRSLLWLTLWVSAYLWKILVVAIGVVIIFQFEKKRRRYS